jgi:hypothetical protein
MKTTLLKTAALAGVLAAAIGGASLAQPAPPQGGPDGRQDGGHRMMMREHMDPAQMKQRRAERLRDVLQLTPRQEPALQEFLASMQPPGGMRERMQGRRQEMAGLSTPERLDRMRAAMGERQAKFEQHAAAVKRFYAQLTPSQQKAFDAMRPMGGHRGGMGGMGGMRGHRMGPGGQG